MSTKVSRSSQQAVTKAKTKPDYVGDLCLIGADMIKEHEIIAGKTMAKVKGLENSMSTEDIDVIFDDLITTTTADSAKAIKSRMLEAKANILALPESDRKGALNSWLKIKNGFLVYWNEAVKEIKHAITVVKDWIRGLKAFAEVHDILASAAGAFRSAAKFLHDMQS